MDRKSRFGIKLRAIRKQRGLTQEQLAELIDRSVDAISNMERGISLPTYETLGRLADKMGLPLAEFTASLDAAPVADPERVELESRLAEMARNLPIRDLRVAVDQVQVLAKHAARSNDSIAIEYRVPHRNHSNLFS